MTDLDPLNVDALLDDALEGKPITDERLAQTLGGKENTEDYKSRSRSRERSDRKRSRSGDRRRSGSRDRDRRRSRRSRSRDKRRSRSRDRGSRRHDDRRRSRSRDRGRRSRSRDRHRRSPRRTPPRGGRFGGPDRRDVMPFTPKASPPKDAKQDMTAEERDFRTVFVMQLARQTRPRDLEEFFSSVGHVRDVRMITDSRTGRPKGIAYIEFWEEESVALALALNGQKLLGGPLVIQRTCAERNRAAAAASTVGTALGFGPTNTKGPVKLNISNIHPNIDENMLRSIFEPFGRVETCKLNKDNKGASIGVGYVIFTKSEDGHKAAEQLHGFDLAGNCMNIRIMDEDTKKNLHDDERVGMISGQAGRAQMMQRLAGGSNVNNPADLASELERDPSIPAIATQCFVLSNMFDPSKESEPGWDEDIKQDVLGECSKHGGALHIYVDKNSDQGNVYVKCPNVAVAFKSVTALHGRWFSGKVITANYVPVNSYHDLFPDAAHLRQPLQPTLAVPAIPPVPSVPGYAMPPMPGYPMMMPPGFPPGNY